MLRLVLLSLVVSVDFLASVPLSATNEPTLASCRRGPVTVMSAPPDRAMACSVAGLARKLHHDIAADLRLDMHTPVSILLLTPNLRSRESPVDAELLKPWFAGVALSGRKMIVVRMRRGQTAADHAALLSHELTHILTAEGYPGSAAWPRWFQEGLAMKQSGGEGFRLRASLSFAAARGRVIPLDILWSSFPSDQAGSRLAYAQSFSVISFLVARHGEEAFRRLLELLKDRTFAQAFVETYGYGLGRLETEWRRHVKLRYSWIPLVTGGTAFWLIILALFFVAVVARRRRSQQLHRQWDDEERETL